ncbi:MAG: HEAT repeat domain-containing protein [Abditibacteriales bacterium]|nr:HEAT repeat domain-containing protein [Abditibacteriales bacterium]MDW8368467.1 HEAT repeat domain-containing protein [Abditibacteriales bacterium]
MDAGFWRGRKVQAHVKDWTITLDTFTASTGNDGVTYTRIRTPFVNEDGFRFTVARSNFFSELGKRWFKIQDIEVGHAEFDRDFIIKGTDEARVRALFANARIRELIQAQPQISFGINDTTGWFGTKLPDGVDELYFVVVGVIKDVTRLKMLFDLFAETLNQLAQMDTVHLEGVPLLIKTLLAPGGQVKDGKVILWDGDAPRRRAAEELGRTMDKRAVAPLLQVLNDADVILREKAMAALANIGDRRAVPALIPLLGDEARINRGNFSGRSPAADALRKLGMEESVEAFSQALFRNKAAVETLKRQHQYQSEFAQAFLRALDSNDTTVAVNAAWSLAELGAIEALPALRARTGQIDFPNAQLRDVWYQAIAKLKSLSALPRPAQATAPDAETLPRPAGQPEIDNETLPRVVE